MRTIRAALLTVLLCMPVGVQAGDAAKLLDTIKADIAADAAHNWSVSRKAQFYDDDGKLIRTTISKRENGKWSLASVNGAAPDAKMLERFNQNASTGKIDIPRYHDLKDFIGPNTRLISENDSQAIFRTVPLPKNAVMFDNKDLSPNLSGDLVVTKGAKPYISSVTVVNTKSFGVSIATVSKFEMMLKYALGPQSLPIAVERSNTAIAKALFKTIVNKSHVELSDHH